MASFLGAIFGYGSTETQPQNLSNSNSQPNDDQIMQSMEQSTSAKPKNAIQSETPQQSKSQSSNSSGFQQFNIQDLHSPQKIQTQKNQKPNIPKSNININPTDMNRTMNFEDDLNLSISDNTYKYIKKSSIEELDLMNFSYKSVNDQSFSELSTGANQMKDSLSYKNRRGFSEQEEQKEKDLQRITQKLNDDSDMEDEYEQDRMKESKKAQDEVNENFSVWGITSRKPSYTDHTYSENHQSIAQSNLQSFSQIDDHGYLEPTKENQKEIQYQISMEQSQEGIKDQEQINLSDMEKSAIAPSIKTIFNKKENPKYQQPTQKYPHTTKPLMSPQKTSQQTKSNAQIINLGESIVMSPVQQKLIKKPSNKLIQDLKYKQQFLQSFLIHTKDYLHFIRYGKNEDRLLSEKLLQSITEFFLIQNIMLPIFNIKLVHDVETEMALQRKEVKMNLFTFCINLYFGFLDKKYPQEMKRFFQSQQGSKSLKSQVGVTARKQETSPIFGNFYKMVLDYLKLSHYSKAQILKNTLETQLQFISQYKQTWLQSWSDNDPNMQQSVEEKELSKRNSVEMQSIKDKEQFLLRKIAELELLTSFQKSEMYCEEKLKEKMQENIWKERKRKLIEDRNFFITHFYPLCFI